MLNERLGNVQRRMGRNVRRGKLGKCERVELKRRSYQPFAQERRENESMEGAATEERSADEI